MKDFLTLALISYFCFWCSRHEIIVNSDCRSHEELLLDNFLYPHSFSKKIFCDDRKHERAISIKNKHVACFRFKGITGEIRTDLSYFYGIMKINSVIAGRALSTCSIQPGKSQSTQWQIHCNANHLTREKLGSTDAVLREVTWLPGVGFLFESLTSAYNLQGMKWLYFEES